MLKKITTIAVTTAIAVTAGTAYANDQIKIVGSSTVYPFVTAAAEEFGNNTDYKTPIVESTGTGGGFKLFCQSTDVNTPNVSNASRAIKSSERELCAANGVNDITEIKIGYDGIVIANSNTSKRFSLTKDQLFRALGKNIPVDGKLVPNTYTKWNEIDPSLPSTEISVYGPPPTSGTRDAFVELVMEKACKDLPEFKAAYEDKKARKKACHLIREDGTYVEAGENDNLIVQKLQNNPNSLGVFGFSFLDQNLASVQGSLVEGVEPTFENISNGSYSVSRPLFVYVKDAHVKTVKSLKPFIDELTSDAAMGEEGYLAERGLISLPADELKKVQQAAKALR
jgi:phosphate transport system substrate-binding protein